MSELQVVLQSNGPFTSDLMQALEESCVDNCPSEEVAFNSRTRSSTSAPISIRPSMNLNQDILSKSLDSGLVLHNVGGSRCRSQSLQCPNPFLTNFSPRTPGGVNINADNLNNKMHRRRGSGAANLNENPTLACGARNINDNMPFPLDMPPLDNVDPLTLDSAQLTSQDSLPLDNTSRLTNRITLTDNLNRRNSAQNVHRIHTNSSIREEEDEEEADLIHTKVNRDRVERLMAEVKAPASANRLSLIQQVTDSIVEAHLETTAGTRDKVDQAFERTSNAPAMPKMPDMASMKAGPAAMWQKMMSVMMQEIMRVIKFSKMVPGFAEFGEDDQMKLIKEGSFKVMLARHSILVDPIKETMLDPTLMMATPREMVRKMPMGAFMDKMFLIAKEVHPLNLDDSELGLFAASLLICPDCKNLTNVRAVRLCQQLFQHALYFLMVQSHPDTYETRFKTLMSLVPLFQKINEDHAKFLEQHKMKSPVEFAKDFPSLHKEVYQSE